MADEENAQALDDNDLDVSGGSLVEYAKDRIAKKAKWTRENPGKAAALIAAKGAAEVGALLLADKFLNQGNGYNAVADWSKKKFGNIIKKKNKKYEDNEENEDEKFTPLEEND